MGPQVNCVRGRSDCLIHLSPKILTTRRPKRLVGGLESARRRSSLGPSRMTGVGTKADVRCDQIALLEMSPIATLGSSSCAILIGVGARKGISRSLEP